MASVQIASTSSDSTTQDAKYSLSAIHKKLEQLKGEINIVASCNPPKQCAPFEPKINPCDMEPKKNNPCSMGPKKEQKQDGSKKKCKNNPCKEKRSLRDSFLYGSDLDKYIEDPLFSGPFSHETNLLHRYRRHVFSKEKCCCDDPCTNCLVFTIQQLLKTADCDCDENDECNSNACGPSCPNKQTNSICANECKENKCNDSDNKPESNCKPKCPPKCGPAQIHDFCSKFAPCPCPEEEEKQVSEDFIKCILTNTCGNNSLLQSTKRSWLGERAISLVVNVREKQLAKLKPDPDEILPNSCNLGWQIGRQSPKKKSKFIIERYDPMLIFRNR